MQDRELLPGLLAQPVMTANQAPCHRLQCCPAPSPPADHLRYAFGSMMVNQVGSPASTPSWPAAGGCPVPRCSPETPYIPLRRPRPRPQPPAPPPPRPAVLGRPRRALPGRPAGARLLRPGRRLCLALPAVRVAVLLGVCRADLGGAGLLAAPAALRAAGGRAPGAWPQAQLGSLPPERCPATHACSRQQAPYLQTLQHALSAHGALQSISQGG